MPLANDLENADVLPDLLWAASLIGLVVLDLAVWGSPFITIETELAHGWQFVHADLLADRSSFRLDSHGVQDNQAIIWYSACKWL